MELRFAVRTLFRNPAFSLAAIATLGLGIGLNTAVFSAVHGLLFRPLDGVRDPGALVQIYRTYPGGFDYGSSSVPHYFDIRDRTQSFDGVAAWTMADVSLSVDGRSERLWGQLVSANFFGVLGTRAALGRTFLPEEDVGAGEHPVVVLSHGFWRERFAADPGVIGRDVTLNGRSFTIVGVAADDFHGPVPLIRPVLWVPLMMQPQIMPGSDRLQQRGSNFMNVVARLVPDVTPVRAQQELTALNAALAEQYPDQYDETTGMLLVRQDEAGVHARFRTAQVGLSAVLMAVVGMLLLIACVNVANLFLARARGRQRELGIRLSLGAGRGRIVRQLMTESLVLAVLAAGAGLVLAQLALVLLARVPIPADVPVAIEFGLDAPVLAFTAVVAILTGLIFGLAPALRASRPDLLPALKGEAGDRRAGRSRISQGLVVAQLALSLVLLATAGLFLRNLRDATSIDTGFRSDNLLVAAMDPGLQGYDPARTGAFYDRLIARVQVLPGVRAAALGEMVPLALGSQQWGITVPGYQPGNNENMSIDYNIVGPGYFEAMGIPVRGRGFQERDGESAPGVAVVNERMAARFWPGRDPIGQRIDVGGIPREIIGVVPTGKYTSLGEAPKSFMYLAHAQTFNHAMVLHVRTAGDPNALLPRIHQEVRALDADLPLFDVRTMQAHLGIALLPARLAGTVLALFGALGLALAAVGVYGVMAYSVARRRREIGIRVALGAHPREVVAMVLRQGGRLALIGIAVGLIGAFAAARLVSGLLYTARPFDAIAFAVVPLLLGAVALVATWLPARRAAAVDPVRALKAE